jgi:hypothetical protein
MILQNLVIVLWFHILIFWDCMVEGSTISIICDNHHHWDPSGFWPNFFGCGEPQLPTLSHCHFPTFTTNSQVSSGATVWHRNMLTLIVVQLKVEGGSSICVQLLCFWGIGLFLCCQPAYRCNTDTVHLQHGLQAMWCASGYFKTILFIWQHCCHYFSFSPLVNKIK